MERRMVMRLKQSDFFLSWKRETTVFLQGSLLSYIHTNDWNSHWTCPPSMVCNIHVQITSARQKAKNRLIRVYQLIIRMQNHGRFFVTWRTRKTFLLDACMWKYTLRIRSLSLSICPKSNRFICPHQLQCAVHIPRMYFRGHATILWCLIPLTVACFH